MLIIYNKLNIFGNNCCAIIVLIQEANNKKKKLYPLTVLLIVK